MCLLFYGNKNHWDFFGQPNRFQKQAQTKYSMFRCLLKKYQKRSSTFTEKNKSKIPNGFPSFILQKVRYFLCNREKKVNVFLDFVYVENMPFLALYKCTIL